MSMERWNPFREIDTMRQAMDRWMDDRVPGNFMGQQGNMLSVALDVHETANGYELEASLPGIRAEDIDINVDRETLTIRGQSESTNQRSEGKNYLYRERRVGSFFRTIRLPEPIDGDKVEATLEHGILRVQLPRLGMAQNRRVQIKSGQMGSSQVSSNSGSQAAVGMGTRMENSSARGESDYNYQTPNTGSNTPGYTQHGSGQTQGGAGAQQTSGTGSTGPNIGGAGTMGSSTAPLGSTSGSQSGEAGGQQIHVNSGETKQPGASQGEHSQVDHRSQTGGQTYTGAGYGESPQSTGNSAMGSGDNPDHPRSNTTEHAQGGAGQYGAGQTSGNVGQSGTMGNQ